MHELKQRMREEDILKIKAIHSKDPSDWLAFRNARNSVNSETKRAKATHYKSAFRENARKMKKTWSFINELTSRKQSSTNMKEINVDGVSVTDPKQLPEAFNDHFASIGLKLAEAIPCNESRFSHLDYVKCKEMRIIFISKRQILQECFLICLNYINQKQGV